MAKPKISADIEPWHEALIKLGTQLFAFGGWRDAVDAVLEDPVGAQLAAELRARCDHPTRDQLQAAAEQFKAASAAGDPEAKAAAKQAMDGAARDRVEHLRKVLLQAWERHHGEEDEWDGGQQALDFGFWTMQAERRAVLGKFVKRTYGSHWPRCRRCSRPYRQHHLRPEDREQGWCWRCVAEDQGVVPPRALDWLPAGVCDARTAKRRVKGEHLRPTLHKRQLRALAYEAMRLSA